MNLEEATIDFHSDIPSDNLQLSIPIPTDPYGKEMEKRKKYLSLL